MAERVGFTQMLRICRLCCAIAAADISLFKSPPDFFTTYEPFRLRIPSFLLMAERVGFEPTAPFGVTGFQDQLLKPLGHLSSCYLFVVLILQTDVPKPF